MNASLLACSVSISYTEREWSPFLGHRLEVKEHWRSQKDVYALSDIAAHWLSPLLFSLVCCGFIARLPVCMNYLFHFQVCLWE